MQRLFIFGFVALLFPVAVYAADAIPTDDLTSFFTPHATDVSVALLGKIFGVVGSVLTGNSIILGKLFGVFNTAVLSLGGIISMYILFVSTLNTCHEGEFMGRKWNSIYIPLRAVGGIALMLPQATGYSVIQVMVMWVVLQGVGAADRIWDATLDHVLTGGTIITPLQWQGEKLEDTRKMGENAGTLLTSLSCMNALQYFISDRPEGERTRKNRELRCERSGSDSVWCQGPANVNFNSTINVLQAQAAGSGQARIYFPTFESGPYQELNGICGSIGWDKIENSSNGTLIEDTEIKVRESDKSIEKLGGVFGGTKTVNKRLGDLNIPQNQLEQISLARALAVQQMFLDMNYLSGRMVDNQFKRTTDPLPLGAPTTGSNRIWSSPNGISLLVGNELSNTTNSYYAILTPTLNLLRNGIDSGQLKFVDEAKRNGWLLAGSYFFDLSQANKNNNQFFEDQQNVEVDAGDSGNLDGSGVIKKLVNSGVLSQRNVQNIDKFLGNEQDTDYIEDNNAVQGYKTNALDYGFSTDSQARIETKASLAALALNTVNPTNNLDAAGAKGGAFNIIGAMAKLIMIVVSVVTGAVNVAWVLAVTVALPMIMNLLSVAAAAAVDTIMNNSDEANPILNLATLGHVMLGMAVNIWEIGLDLSMIAGSLSQFGAGPAATMMYMAPILIAFLTMCFSSGIFLAYYIPLLPYILFTLGGVAWMIAVIEAMVAAPIVAMGVMHPEGHELFGKAGDQSIMLLLNVFLRPPMMVIGLIAGILLSAAAVDLINTGFQRAFSHLSAGSAFNFISLMATVEIFVMITIYVLMVTIVIQKSLALIHIIPDKVLSWLSGFNAVQLGAETSQMSHDLKSGMTGATSQIAGSGARSGLARQDAQAGREVGAQNLHLGDD